YEIALRRWPEEVNAPIRVALFGRTDVPFVSDFVPSEALPLVGAKLQVGDVIEEKPIGEHDCAVVFEARLQTGKTRLQTELVDEQGKCWGAYYVYVKRIGD
ncbi:MAG: hypothetical protein O7G87_11055, partial [bacterium]|nr:hypothetical protein [bacterium]